MENVVIIGTGPAGYTAAIYCARAGLKPVVISGNLPGGLLTQTTDIENFPGFPSGVNGFELMDNMQKQAERFGALIRYDSVSSVIFKSGGPQEIELAGGDKIITKTVIIATGSNPRWLGIDAEKRLMGKGVSACATCDGAFFKGLPVVVIGGGDTAMEEALFLTRFASSVTVIHRRDELRASKVMVERAMANDKIKFVWNSVVTDISGTNEVESVIVLDLKTNGVSTIQCKGYFAALGHVPATGTFKPFISMDESGHIRLENNNSRTNIDGVFAAGDCADKTYKQAITAAGMGCRAAIDAERWLEGK